MDIRKYQKTPKLLVLKVAFRRYVVDSLQSLRGDKNNESKRVSRMKPEVFKVLQIASGAFISDVMNDAGFFMLLTGRETLMLEDFYLAIKMRGYDITLLR